MVAGELKAIASGELSPYWHFSKHLASRLHSLARSTPPPTCAPTLPRSSTSRASVLSSKVERPW
jgi:hypothetical protein